MVLRDLACKMVPAVVWVLFRRLRYSQATLFGSNEIAKEKVGVAWQRDWDVVEVVKRVAANPPRLVRQDEQGRSLWNTLAGDFWAPPGASAHYVTMLTVEILSDTYHFAAQDWNAPPIVFDCGANIGVFSRMALDRGAEKVICCEPSPLTAECLDLTFRAEIESGRLVVIRKGVWDRTETLRFSASNQANPGSHCVTDNNTPDAITIDVTTVDSLVAQLGLSHVDFIKMDIEGAEERALRGAQKTIRAFRPRLGVGTEHTADIAANNARVINTLREIDPTYRVVCTEVHAERSPSLGLVLTPYSLSFQ